jgi:hypothetical protein
MEMAAAPAPADDDEIRASFAELSAAELRAAEVLDDTKRVMSTLMQSYRSVRASSTSLLRADCSIAPLTRARLAVRR